MISRNAVEKVLLKSLEFKLKERTFTNYRLPFNVKTIDFLYRIKKTCLNADSDNTIRSTTVNFKSWESCNA